VNEFFEQQGLLWKRSWGLEYFIKTIFDERKKKNHTEKFLGSFGELQHRNPLQG
jgi:hypothetical protein